MTTESAAAVTDIALSAGTFFLGLTVGKRKTFRTWTALFICMGLASALGSIFHGFERFHTSNFWPVVATTATASAFLFLAANITLAKPNWPWIQWLWPLMGLAGILLGGLLANMPFYYISIVGGICIVASILVLQKAANKSARNFIYIGMAITVLGLFIQKAWHGDGLSSNNALYHLLQLAGNISFWMGARRT